MADDVNQTTSSAGSSGEAQGTSQDHAADPARQPGETMKAAGQKMAKGSSTIGLKLIEQAEQNTREAFAAMREAAQASDLNQVAKIQGEYLREQSNRSMAQAREVGELIMQLGRDATSPLRGGK